MNYSTFYYISLDNNTLSFFFLYNFYCLLTLYMTLAVLTDYAGTVLLVCWPFVDEHGSMSRSSIQDYSILGAKTEQKPYSIINAYNK